MTIKLEDMSLRKGERGLIIGRSGSGKSTLAEKLVWDFVNRYPKGVTLIVDSKPRFRAERYANGSSCKRRYKSMDHGTAMPGSVLVTSPEELDLALKTKARLIIAQDPAAVSGDKDPNYGLLTHIVSRFMATARASLPRLVYVDETLDFFAPNGQGVKGTTGAILRVARAGREKGVALLLSSQRVKGIPTQTRSELVRLYLMAMDFTEDIDLRDAGAPAHLLDTPTRDHHFVYWTKQDRPRVYGPYSLSL